MKHLKINMKLIQFPWITLFFKIFIINPLCVVLNNNEPGPKGPMPHGKGLRVLTCGILQIRKKVPNSWKS
jgi:hypothetical protein